MSHKLGFAGPRSSGCGSGARVPPAKYRNNGECNQAERLTADQHPVPDRRGISMNNVMRIPDKKLRVDVLDFSRGQAIAQQLVAIEEQIDRDATGDDFMKEKLHPNICPSGADGLTGPYYPSIGRVTAVIASALPGLSVGGSDAGSNGLRS
jgi:hypothetical protein